MKCSHIDLKVKFVPLAPLPMCSVYWIMTVSVAVRVSVSKYSCPGHAVSPVAYTETELTERASLHSSKSLLKRRSVAM